MRVLVVDVGGSNVKILASGQDEKRRVKSGSRMTADQMVTAVRELAGEWQYDVVSIGYPGRVLRNKPVLEPANLGAGWTELDFAKAFERPVKIVNDAVMQAVGGYDGGCMLFLGLGTGLGSALIVQNVAHPLELAHLPYRKGRSFEEYVGVRALKRSGKRKWQEDVADVVKRLQAALLPDHVMIGGGNVAKLKKMPPGSLRGDNANAFRGGFRLWAEDSPTL